MQIELHNGRVISPFNKTDVSGKFELVSIKKQRSGPQNKYLHGYLFPEASKAFSKTTGKAISPELAKAVLKSTCAVEYIEAVKEWVVIPTSKMSTKQVVTFIDKSLKYIAEKTGEYLLEPNEEDYSKINLESENN